MDIRERRNVVMASEVWRGRAGGAEGGGAEVERCGAGILPRSSSH